MLLLKLLIISAFSYYSICFTREYRSIDLTLSRINESEISFMFDPIALNLNISTQYVCFNYGCVNNNNVSSQFEFLSEILNLYNNRMSYDWNDFFNLIIEANHIYLNRINLSDLKWIHLTDNITFDRLDDMSNNMNNIPYMNDFIQSNITPIKSKISNKYILNSYDLLNDYINIDVWVNTMLDLFNNEDYQLVEIMLSSYLYKLKSVLNVSNLPDEYKKIFFIILSETSRINNRLDWSMYWSYQIINISYPNIYTNHNIIHRIRMILSIPIFSLSYNITNKYRKEIENDLLNILYEINLYNITISLNELSQILFTNFHMSHQGINDKPLQTLLAQIYKQLCPDLSYQSIHLPMERNQKIRIGFLSTHFNNHSISKILLEMILILYKISIDNTYRYEFEIFVLYISTIIPINQSCSNVYNTNIDLSTYSLYSKIYIDTLGANFIFLCNDINIIRECISNLKLDILIYPDIGMDYVTYALAFSRLATYQICWWGHPITTGLNTIDYYFSLDNEIKFAGLEHYIEQLVRFEYMNTAPMQQLIEFNDKIDVYNLMKIPLTSKYMFILSKLFKIHPSFLEVVLNILSIVNDCYVVLISERNFLWNDIIYDKIVLYSNNSTEIIGRFRFMNYQNYYKILPHASVVLDTFPYGGCLTTHDSMSYSVPIVTLPLEFIRGRYTSGMYQQMGYTDLIANSIENYMEIVIQLLIDDNYYQYHRNQLISHYYSLHKNNLVAEKWLDFFGRLFHL